MPFDGPQSVIASVIAAYSRETKTDFPDASWSMKIVGGGRSEQTVNARKVACERRREEDGVGGVSCDSGFLRKVIRGGLSVRRHDDAAVSDSALMYRAGVGRISWFAEGVTTDEN